MRRLPIVAVAVLATACQPRQEESRYRLHDLTSCSDVEDQIRDSAVRHMSERISENYRMVVENDWYGGDVAMDEAGSPAPNSGGSGPDAYSDTNNQVAGVDEADFVKTDGDYLYVVSGTHFRIIDAWPAPEAHVIAEVELEGTPKRLFVQNNEALIYSSVGDESGGSYPDGGWYPGECTYGYSCQFTGDGRPTQVSVFDIQDRTAPELVAEIDLSGSYIAARRIGNQVYTVVYDHEPQFEGVSYWPTEDLWNASEAQIRAAFIRLRRHNAEIIRNTPADDWLPHATLRFKSSKRGWLSSDLLDDCSGFLASDASDGAGQTSLISLNLAHPSETALTSVTTRPGAVYASSAALYMAVPRGYSYYGYYGQNEDEKSTIHKFQLEGAQSEYRGSGLVKGRVLNQFSMDEYDERLRVATTTGHVPNPQTYSTLSVLEQQGEDLVITGAVDHIAPSEDIRSVRFDGERAFLVTFKKTDPLFLYDLSDPAHPDTLAELKIPGFSTYMHMMDDDHLLTIGYDADDQGDFAWFQGVLLQIFDVSDMSAPTLAHKELIGTRGSSSAALTNHLAFNYFAARDLLALPMTVCEDSAGGGNYGQEMTFSGLMVYDVTAESGFSYVGGVEHDPGADIGCWNWWTNATSQVERSVIMDDYVFSISRELIKVNDTGDLSTDLASIPIAD